MNVKALKFLAYIFQYRAEQVLYEIQIQIEYILLQFRTADNN